MRKILLTILLLSVALCTPLYADTSHSTLGGNLSNVTQDINIGSITAGHNLNLYATQGAEMATSPMVTGGWTLGYDAGVGGWAINAGVLSKTASTGTQAALAVSGMTAPTVGVTYKVTIVYSAVGTLVSGTFGGSPLTNMVAAGTSVDYVTAATTTKLTLSASAASTCTITSISIKPLTDATGDLTVSGNLTVGSPIVIGSGSATNLAISFQGDPNTGIARTAEDVIGIYAGGTKLSFSGSYLSIMHQSGTLLFGTGLDTILTRDTAQTLAQRNGTSQQVWRLYNTADTAGTFTNYERLTLTGVAGASVNVTAETAGTGGDNLDVVLTAAGTGGTVFNQKEINMPSTNSGVTAAQVSNTQINNYGQTADVTLTLPAAARGLAFTVALGQTQANFYRITPNASDSIYIDGVTTGDGKYVGVAAAGIGYAISFVAVQTGATTWDWVASIAAGPWVAQL